MIFMFTSQFCLLVSFFAFMAAVARYYLTSEDGTPVLAPIRTDRDVRYERRNDPNAGAWVAHFMGRF